MADIVGRKKILLTGIILFSLFALLSGMAWSMESIILFRAGQGIATSMVNYSATFAVGFWVSLYLQVVKGFDADISGLILLSQPIIMAVFSPFTGALSDRVEPRIVASWGMGTSTVGLLAFTFVTPQTSAWLIIANLIIIGIGFALFSSPNNNAIMSAVKKEFYGVAASTLSTSRLFGQAISMAIVSLILSIYLGSAGLAPEHSGLLMAGFRSSFIVFTLLCAGGVFASLARGNSNR